MMNARLLGFVIGVVLMVAIPVIAGAPVEVFLNAPGRRLSIVMAGLDPAIPISGRTAVPS